MASLVEHQQYRKEVDGTIGSVSNVATGDRTATRDEVLAARRTLRQLAAHHGLAHPHVDATRTVVVHSEDPGYGSLRRYAMAASRSLGVWANVITDDAPAAEVATEAL